jgi:hypothetical protein
MRFVLDPTALEEEASHVTASLVHTESRLVFAVAHMPRVGACIEDLIAALAPQTSDDVVAQRSVEHATASRVVTVRCWKMTSPPTARIGRLATEKIRSSALSAVGSWQ